MRVAIAESQVALPESCTMEPLKLTEGQFDRFRDFIYAQSGIRVGASKITLASNRIRRRLKANDLADFDAYYRLLTSRQGAAELSHFLDAIATNETQFFRTPAQFDWFAGTFLDQLVAARERREREAKLRVCSAACSSGEEPYSLAICLSEQAHRLRGWEISILGIDISETALAAAREAVFGERTLELVSHERRRNYFERLADGDRWRLIPPIRTAVEFRRHNLMKPLRALLRQPAFDCIFLRNVMIYFDRASKVAAIEHLQRVLAPGGYMVIGPSEGVFDMLAPLVKRAPNVYQKA
jgi:chemotaxis protein methyltransferase CheR